MAELTCVEVQDAAPEFALDILAPGRRAELEAHLDRCSACRTSIDGMCRSAQHLLDIDSYDHSGRRAYPARKRFRVVTTLAAAAVLMLGSTLGSTLVQTTAGKTPVASAELLQNGQAVGVVAFYAGTRPSVVLEVKGLTASGKVTFEVQAVDGSVTRLGDFKLYSGAGSWASSARLNPGKLSAVALIDAQGHVVAQASVS